MNKGGTLLIIIILLCTGWYMYKLGYFDVVNNSVNDIKDTNHGYIPFNLENIIDKELNKYSTEEDITIINKDNGKIPIEYNRENQYKLPDKQVEFRKLQQ